MLLAVHLPLRLGHMTFLCKGHARCMSATMFLRICVINTGTQRTRQQCFCNSSTFGSRKTKIRHRNTSLRSAFASARRVCSSLTVLNNLESTSFSACSKFPLRMHLLPQSIALNVCIMICKNFIAGFLRCMRCNISLYYFQPCWHEQVRYHTIASRNAYRSSNHLVLCV